jgi:hypothetical protein
MLGAALVHPDRTTVIPVCPEPILKQDGHDKNDCERNAGRRFLSKFRQDHPKLKVIVIQDALSATAPHIKDLKDHGMRFILSVQPGSHVQLFRGIEKREQMGDVRTFEHREVFGKKIRKFRTHRFRYCQDVLLSGSDPNLAVNFLDYEEITEWVDPWGEKQRTVVHFSWVTDLKLTDGSLMNIMRGGRCRWKIENETFNTIKNQGYEFEHNFGHGKKHLTTVFAYLMMLAFLVDQIQEHCCLLFQAALRFSGPRYSLWEFMRALYRIRHFAHWDEFLTFMAASELPQAPDTS